tara:strand:- start:90690 stop:90821 length:132 start_codon:yes stop_codon:yes gene_type:complete
MNTGSKVLVETGKNRGLRSVGILGDDQRNSYKLDDVFTVFNEK